MIDDFYASKAWKLIRERILQRDEYICQLCGIEAKDVLIVHHKKPRKIYPELALKEKNLITLCKRCHYNHHKYYIQKLLEIPHDIKEIDLDSLEIYENDDVNVCKYCGNYVIWTSENYRKQPLNLDRTKHICRKYLKLIRKEVLINIENDEY